MKAKPNKKMDLKELKQNFQTEHFAENNRPYQILFLHEIQIKAKYSEKLNNNKK